MGWPGRVAVVGAGYMGQGIAEALVLAGCDCALADQSAELAAAAREHLFAEADVHETNGLIPTGSTAVLRSRVRAAKTIEDAVGGADLVVEAVFELRAVKEAVLRRIAAAASPSAVIATNTSSMSISSLSACITQPERFLGAHWFNPPQFVPGVEVISCGATSDQVLEQVEDLLRRAGKQPARAGDQPGFVANRLQYALFQEAAAVVEEGIATPEAVDEIVRSTFGFRLPFFGPFAIADMAGLDVYRGTYAILEEAYEGHFVAPGILLDLIAAGALGAKSGRGFVIGDMEQAAAMAASRNRAYVAMGRLVAEFRRGPLGDHRQGQPDDRDRGAVAGDQGGT
jgi:3-hydroxybutyryl-CoA dehydrogenase